jgi:hypothetical protein
MIASRPAPAAVSVPTRNGPAQAGRQVAEQHVLHALEEHGAERDRDQQQEREACGGVAVEAQEAAGRDRHARARHARHEREHLREADEESVAHAEVVEVQPLRRAVGDPEQHREQGEQDRDLPGVAQVVRDRVLAGGADDRGGHRGERDRPRQPLLSSSRRAACGSTGSTRA